MNVLGRHYTGTFMEIVTTISHQAFLRRLESVRPTRGMKRAEQLADYQRQAGYLGIATSLSAMDRSPSKMERTSSRTSPGQLSEELMLNSSQ